ncbi:MAG: cytochrome c family protein [Pseudomonadota bacterium]
MNSWEINKIAGALLSTLLLVMGINMLAGALFAPTLPERPGFEIAVEETGATEAVEEPEEETVPLAMLLAEAAVEDGERAARKCSSCHVFEQGGDNRVGPVMWEVLNRAKGAIDGFGYSDAMMEVAANGEVWGYDELDGFLANPRDYLPGTSMGFAGIRSPEERADLIVYLRSLSDSPAPLPELAAAEPEVPGEAPAADETPAVEEAPAVDEAPEAEEAPATTE